MDLTGIRIGVGITGSFCTINRVIPHLEELVKVGADLTAILSPSVATCDTRYGKAGDLEEKLRLLTGNKIMKTIVQVEPAGPMKLFDAVLIAPCTGNTMAKIANSITDTPVAMAAKSQLRNERPVVLAIASNDILGLNAKNLGVLLNAKNVYFVPFGQDNPFEKPNSIESDFALIGKTIEFALQGRQIQPVMISRLELKGERN